MTIGTKNNLHNLIGDAILFTVALDKQQPCRWIRHPQAVSNTNENSIRSYSPVSALFADICAERCIWGHGSGAKENAPTVSFVCGHCLEATRSTININLFMELTNVIYTFLIATRNQTLSTLSRIRTVSATADSEEQARAQLNGLPLVFVSCKANKAGV